MKLRQCLLLVVLAGVVAFFVFFNVVHVGQNAGAAPPSGQSESGGTERVTGPHADEDVASMHALSVFDASEVSAINDNKQRPVKTVDLDQVAFGIPTTPRLNNPAYLRQTIESMVSNGVQPSQIYVMRTGKNTTHPVYESVRSSFQIMEVKGVDFLIHTEYDLPLWADEAAMDVHLKHSAEEKRWRVNEARDFIVVMRDVLARSDAHFVGLNQDDGVWTKHPTLLDVPMQSLYHGPPRTHTRTCSLPCGMVSVIFRRDVLKKFLRRLVGNDLWKLKPIDWALEDFIRAGSFEYLAVSPFAVRHIGDQSSLESRIWNAGSVWTEMHDPPPGVSVISAEAGITTCARIPLRTIQDPVLKSVCSKFYRAQGHLNLSLVPYETVDAASLDGIEFGVVHWTPPDKCTELNGVVNGTAVTLDQIAFGVPTISRQRNQTHLRLTIESMLASGVHEQQIFVMNTVDTPHPVHDSTMAEHPGLSVVGRSSMLIDTAAHDVAREKEMQRKRDAVTKILRSSMRVSNVDITIGSAAADHQWHEQKAWRTKEARDFIVLMREVLARSSAPFVALQQDDGLWVAPPELLGTPLQSLYHYRHPEMECGLGCGVVATIFRRDVLKNFLRTIVSNGSYKKKSLDWLLEDFAYNFADGYEWPATRSVRHLGGSAARDSGSARRITAGPYQPRPSHRVHAVSPDDRGKVYSCFRQFGTPSSPDPKRCSKYRGWKSVVAGVLPGYENVASAAL